MVGGSMNGKTNNPPGGYSMEVVTLRPPFCFACAYSRNVWQVPRTGDALPGGKVDADIKKSPHASVSEAVGASWVMRRVGYSPTTPLLQVAGPGLSWYSISKICFLLKFITIRII